MNEAEQIRVVLLDALGTLVRLLPPAPRLRGELARLGFDVTEAAAKRAFGAEIAFYVEHHTEGRGHRPLAQLRDRRAAGLPRELGGAGVAGAAGPPPRAGPRARPPPPPAAARPPPP